MATQVRILTASDVKKALGMREAIEVNKRAFVAACDGSASVPPRMLISEPQFQGTTLIKPAFINNYTTNTDNKLDNNNNELISGFGMKVVSVRPNNAQKGLPTVPGFIVLVNPITGILEALMDATYLTALRTAAGSGVATDMMARQDATVLAVFGAGMQAQLHIEAMLCVRKITRIFIVNKTKDNADKLAAETKTQYPDIQVESVNLTSRDQVQAILTECDIIVTATNSSTPLFDGTQVSKRGVHINAVGSYTPTMQELDETTVSRAKIVLDTVHALDAGDLQIPLKSQKIEKDKHVLGELGEVIVRGVQVRTQDTDITLFKSVGTAVQDIATAQAVLHYATQQHLGTAVPL